MPYTMNRVQAARKLAIRVYLDEHPGVSYTTVQERFGVGPNVVRDASCKTVARWVAIVAKARATDVKHERPGKAVVPVHWPTTSASPGVVYHPDPVRDARFPRRRAPGEGDDDWLTEPVDFDQDEPLEKAGLLEKKRKGMK